jgi:hypothetical protein
MKLNFKNLSDSIKRIRLIPKAGAGVSANIGVENPTLDISENGEVTFCLAPSGDNGGGTGGTGGTGIVIDASNATSHIAIGFVYSLNQYFSGAIKIVEQNLDGSYETLMTYIAAEDATVQNFVDTLPQFISDLTIEEMALPNGNPAIHLINSSNTNRKFFIVTTNLSGTPFNNWGAFSNNYSMSEDIGNSMDAALYAHTTYNVGVHYSFVLAAM